MSNIFSRLALGTAAWGKEYNGVKISEDEQKRILDYCQCSGIDLIDTATAYEWDWTKISSYFDVVVKVQVGEDINPILETEPYAILGHNIETYHYLRAMNKEFGRTKQHVKRGVSVYEPTYDMYGGSIVQIPYSIYDRRWESYIAEQAEDDTYEIHVRSIFLRGKILERFKPWECIAFCLANPYIDRIIIGVDSYQQLKDNLRIFHRWESSSVEDENILDPRKWCKHEWVSADNKVVSGAEICSKCHVVRPKPTTCYDNKGNIIPEKEKNE